MSSIWIADDDRSIRWVLGKALEREGVDYRLFEDASSVLAALNEERPSVLVTDIRMPGMTGTDLLRRVKEKYPELPVSPKSRSRRLFRKSSGSRLRCKSSFEPSGASLKAM